MSRSTDDRRYALMHDGVRVGLYEHLEDAYTAGMELYGADDGELRFDIHELGAAPAVVMSRFVE